MSEQKTYELRISFGGSPAEKNEQKQILLAWLPANGVVSFVEGVVDSLDLDPDYDNTNKDFYGENGGRVSPVSVFDYKEANIKSLEKRLLSHFGSKVKQEVLVQETSTWQEGWKESFKPLTTEKFCIHPPWDVPSETGGKIFLEIEPGMAFGTGQHQTTQLCLKQIEHVAATSDEIEKLRFMDVGTGSGILAIAAKKLGFGHVYASDIEAAAVHAATENARANDVDINIWKGSVPVPSDERDDVHTPYDVVVANILIIVLERIIYDISEITVCGGRLVLSGLLAEQEKQMLEMTDEFGFGFVEKHQDGDWICLELEKLQ